MTLTNCSPEEFPGASVSLHAASARWQALTATSLTAETASSAGEVLHSHFWQKDGECWVKWAARQLSYRCLFTSFTCYFQCRGHYKRKGKKIKKEQPHIKGFKHFLQSLIKLLNLYCRQLSLTIGKMKCREVKGLIQGQWQSQNQPQGVHSTPAGGKSLTVIPVWPADFPQSETR